MDGKTIFIVTVSDDRRQAYSVDGRYQVRKGSFRRTLDGDEILALLNSRGRYAYDATLVPGARRSHLNERLVQTFVARCASGGRMDPDALLEARGLLARPSDDPDAPLVPTVAGLLLLGTHPRQFLPQARIAVVRYATAVMGERFLARELEGPITAQLDAAEAWLTTNMMHGVTLSGWRRTDTDEYPRAVLRELVLNGLAHRDYIVGGDRIRIYLFGTDRLEIHSPGGLSGPMRADNLLQRRYSRNRTLVQGLIAFSYQQTQRPSARWSQQDVGAGAHCVGRHGRVGVRARSGDGRAPRRRASPPRLCQQRWNLCRDRARPWEELAGRARG